MSESVTCKRSAFAAIAAGAGILATAMVVLDPVDGLRFWDAAAAMASFALAIHVWCTRPERATKGNSAREEGAWDAVCPCCGAKGRRVPASTVRAMFPEPRRGEIPDVDYVFCDNPACESRRSSPTGMTMQIFPAKASGPRLVCTCAFGTSEEGSCRCEIVQEPCSEVRES